MATGGFLKPGQSLDAEPDYKAADVLILTFLVNNHHNKSELGPALKWEAHFVEFMKNYTERQLPPNMEIAFNSERSIEDELNRESQSDIGTILISYFIMFAYITGKVRV